MSRFRPRPAVRALILDAQSRLLLVNAWPGNQSDLWAAPGGGCISGASLRENLVREVHEETGLAIAVGAPGLVNEFHDPKSGYHQIEVFFRCTLLGGTLDPAWQDPERIVTRRRFFAREDLIQGHIRFKPDLLPDAAWGEGCLYDPLEEIVT